MNWMNAVRKARKDGDEKQLDKLMKRQSAVMKMSSRATLEQLKTYPITIVPFYLIYAVLGYALSSTPYTAYAPSCFPSPQSSALESRPDCLSSSGTSSAHLQ